MRGLSRSHCSRPATTGSQGRRVEMRVQLSAEGRTWVWEGERASRSRPSAAAKADEEPIRGRRHVRYGRHRSISVRASKLDT